MCIEKMIDGMSDACYLEHYCFRHRLHSCSLAAQLNTPAGMVHIDRANGAR